MKPIRLLYLTAHQMTACCWHSGVLTTEGQFPATEAGYQAFAAYLEHNLKSVFSILCNISEEGFQIESIPYLRGSDRQAIISRKLGQLFFNTPLTASQSRGYAKTKRKDERVLLAALTNKELFPPWLNAIKSAGVALSGIYSLPLLVPGLLHKLQLAEDQCLFLSIQDQSIRQSYFEKGELCFSRLAPLQNSSIGGIAQTFFAEAHKLQQYLVSQRLIGRTQAITAHILAHPSAVKAIQNSCGDSETIQFNILNIEDCAKKTGLRMPLSGSHCELLFLNLLACSPSRIQFADDDLRHGFHLGQIRSILHGAGAFALVGCLLFSGKLFFEASTVSEQTAVLKTETSQDRQRYNEIIKSFPPIPTDHDTLRSIIDRFQTLNKQTSTPEGLFREISHALQVAPSVELESIDWRVEGAEANAAQTASSPAAGTLPADSEAALVRGTLKLSANANARQMLAAFNVLVDALKTNPKLQIDVLQRPFDIESGKSLKGGDTTVEDNKPRSFNLQITRKIGS